jgi:glycerol-3-phosphate dehydrogenase
MTRKDVDSDVVILGGGCAGLWLANEVTNAGYSCIVVDERQLGAFSSTRNQGWLQSGALYAAMGQPDVAEECKTGFSKILEVAREVAPESIRRTSASFFLYANPTRFGQESERLREGGFSPKIVPLGNLPDEPLLRDTIVRYAIETDDRPVDTRQLLIGLTQKLLENGGSVLLLENGLNEFFFENDKQHWNLRLEHLGLKCKLLVLCCGAFIPNVLQKLSPGPRPGKDWFGTMHRTKVAVASVHAQITDSMLLVRDSRGPNLVPFNGGVSICVSGADLPIQSHAEFFVEEAEINEIARQISVFFPSVVEQTPFSTHFYSCQKLNPYEEVPAGGEAPTRKAYWRDHASQGLTGVFSFYPGKFTSAPAAAGVAVSDIRSALGTPGVHSARSSDLGPRIAVRHYYDRPTHVGVKSGTEPNSWLSFERTDYKALDLYQGSEARPQVGDSA